VAEIPFDRNLMATPWADFLSDLTESGACGFVCGSDFRFGAGGRGTAERLAAYCEEQDLPYAIVPQQMLDGERVSSTHIRSLIAEGKMEAAVRFLGHPHMLSGKVISGKQLGRTIGIPTANLVLPEGLLAPKFGVYACKAYVEGSAYLAVTNVGTRPTVSGEGVTVEAHLLDFDGDLYGKNITLAFYNFLRPEQKFDSLDALKAQIAEDIAKVCTILK